MSEERRPSPLRREPENGLLGGVCAGIGSRLGIDPLLVRVTVVVVAVATAGLGALAYLAAWLAMPAQPAGTRATPSRRPRRGGGWRVGAGAGLLALAGLLVLRELGIWWSDAVVWPLVLAISGAALLWRQSRIAAARAEPTPAVPPHPGSPEPERRPLPVADLYRGGFGIALVLGAALLFLSANDALGEVRDTAFAAIAVALAIALILAPFLWRLGRNLAAERAERIRSQERAELAAHIHDSVLQTLTLMQKRADDPRAVATLARRQERELRSWLFDRTPDASGDTLASALAAAAAEVEDAREVAIDVVSVGDRRLDAAGEALVAAAREALTNAAKFAGAAGPISVYAEMDPEGASVFVRDRGNGFDLDSVPADRRGIRESIIGRMERNGGRANVHRAASGGTEVELVLGAAGEGAGV